MNPPERLEIDSTLGLGKVLLDDVHHLLIDTGDVGILTQDNIGCKLVVAPLVQF